MVAADEVICIDSDGEGDATAVSVSQQADLGQLSGGKGASAKRRTPSAKEKSLSSDSRQSTLKDVTPDPSQKNSGSSTQDVVTINCPVCQRIFRREREAQLHIIWCLEQAERRELTQPAKSTPSKARRERSDKTLSQKAANGDQPLTSIQEDQGTPTEKPSQPREAGTSSREAGADSSNGPIVQENANAVPQESFGHREITKKSAAVVTTADPSENTEGKNKDASDKWVSARTSEPKQPPAKSKGTTASSTGKEKGSQSTAKEKALQGTAKEKSSLSTAKEKSSRLALKNTSQRKAAANPATQPAGLSAHRKQDTSSANAAPAATPSDATLPSDEAQPTQPRRTLVISNPGAEAIELCLRGCVQTDWRAASDLGRAWLDRFSHMPVTPLPLPARARARAAVSAAAGSKRRLSDFLLSG